ncbi:MAG: AAA family ATPase [Marinifilaceae bacterium]|jgi:exodeoxyribonuclease V alpha subunit|nr:AAA family ATPase [Marinifilaceae bacterium]
MEKLIGIIQRITYHNEETGWTVLKVSPVDRSHEIKVVTVHQASVFAGATMQFEGQWVQHAKYGEQFKTENSIELKPASASALQKYIGSGLIYGVGPKIAKRIVGHFGDETLDVFEENIDRLTEVSGIAKTKLDQIKESWTKHREIRNVMLFLQDYGISTLFAVKIFKTYGNDAIKILNDNPYQLSKDIYGIGFFSADKVARALGIKDDNPKRIRAAISHVLAASRESGHCYLEIEQIHKNLSILLKANYPEAIDNEIVKMEQENELKTRIKQNDDSESKCYYSKSLYYDELNTSDIVKQFLKNKINVDENRLKNWLQRFNDTQEFPLSDEQFDSVVGVCKSSFAILTGGPGCGKTTTTKALVKLLLAMNKKVCLAAPTGRASQRMSEVIGMEAKTIHRLLVWQPNQGQFKKNEEDKIETDYIIVDECSMLDISITAALLKAIPLSAQILFIGDPNQLPSVGAGNVLKDLIDSRIVPCFELKKVFRQAQESYIIKFAHQINERKIPSIESPINNPNVWDEKIDCLFFDSDEATKEQSDFIRKIKHTLKDVVDKKEQVFLKEKHGEDDFSYKSVDDNLYVHTTSEYEIEEMKSKGIKSYVFHIPSDYVNTNIKKLVKSESTAAALKNILKSIHPWSSLHYGFIASELLIRLYTKTLREKLGKDKEIQILSPMTVGSMGTRNLNVMIQERYNPDTESKPSLLIGERIFRLGDRVIQRRNNYDLEVFNGDIGFITAVDNQDYSLEVSYKLGDTERQVYYQKQDIIDLDLAYAITIHKSQGSEFDIVIIPLVLQHFNMLYQNLIYTALTRAKKACIFVGTRKALGIAVRNIDNRMRKTMLRTIVAE